MSMKDRARILFVHGNPTWSFMYRHLIKGLSAGFRCVAPDHIGCGLSDKPFDVSYLPQFHAENLERFIDRRGLKDITLVIHDWGGAIGMSYALNHPENVKRLIVLNTSFRSVKEIKEAEDFSRYLGGPVGRFVCRYFNVFPRFIVPYAFGNKSKLTRSVHPITSSRFRPRSPARGPGSSQRRLSAKATGLHRYGLNGIASRVSLCRFCGA
jgi:haloalkane dehalogenase